MTTETPDARKTRVKKIITALKQAHPDAGQALEYSNPLELLIALILAAQARDDLVNSVTADVFPDYETAAAWADEDPEKLEQRLRKINFYRKKTAAVQKACRALVDKYQGQVPDNLDDLLTVPGIGRKTANFILGDAFGKKSAIGVDTHVARLAQRLGLSDNTNPDKIEADLAAVVPSRSGIQFCHALQFHGRRVCLAKRPDCGACTVNKLCPFPDKEGN
jgi:endonuclease-3